MQTGAWKHTAGEYPGAGFESDKGIQTSEDARFYSLTAPLSAEFNNKDKDLIISYTVKHEQNIDCGGAYIKVCIVIAGIPSWLMGPHLSLEPGHFGESSQMLTDARD